VLCETGVLLPPRESPEPLAHFCDRSQTIRPVRHTVDIFLQKRRKALQKLALAAQAACRLKLVLGGL
jgi:hypothetical protein